MIRSKELAEIRNYRPNANFDCKDQAEKGQSGEDSESDHTEIRYHGHNANSDCKNHAEKVRRSEDSESDGDNANSDCKYPAEKGQSGEDSESDHTEIRYRGHNANFDCKDHAENGQRGEDSESDHTEIRYHGHNANSDCKDHAEKGQRSEDSESDHTEIRYHGHNDNSGCKNYGEKAQRSEDSESEHTEIRYHEYNANPDGIKEARSVRPEDSQAVSNTEENIGETETIDITKDRILSMDAATLKIMLVRFARLLEIVMQVSPDSVEVLGSLLCSYASNYRANRKDDTEYLMSLYLGKKTKNYFSHRLQCKPPSEDNKGEVIEEIILERFKFDPRKANDVLKAKKNGDYDGEFGEEFLTDMGYICLLQAMLMNTDPTDKENSLINVLFNNQEFRLLKKVSKELIEKDHWTCSGNKMLRLGSLDTKIELQVFFGDKKNFTFQQFLAELQGIMINFFESKRALYYRTFAIICLNIAFASTKKNYKASLCCLEKYIYSLRDDRASNEKNKPFDSILMTKNRLIYMMNVCKFSVYSRVQKAKKYFFPLVDIEGIEVGGLCECCYSNECCMCICWLNPCNECCLKTEKKENADYLMWLLHRKIGSIDQQTTSEDKQQLAAVVFVEGIATNYKSVGARNNKITAKGVAMGIAAIGGLVIKKYGPKMFDTVTGYISNVASTITTAAMKLSEEGSKLEE